MDSDTDFDIQGTNGDTSWPTAADLTPNHGE
jgi:hypothetical protein